LSRVIKMQAEHATGPQKSFRWTTSIIREANVKRSPSRYIPLLRTRGVPGTHEIELLLSVLAALPNASDKLPVTWPRFDKGRDTRMPPSRWPRVTRRRGW
jgi:D-glycerate 3-kinase